MWTNEFIQLQIELTKYKRYKVPASNHFGFHKFTADFGWVSYQSVSIWNNCIFSDQLAAYKIFTNAEVFSYNTMRQVQYILFLKLHSLLK